MNNKQPHYRKGGQKGGHKKKKFDSQADNGELLHLLRTETPGYLEAEGMERTYKITQEQLVEAVPLQTAKKRFELALPDGGGYNIDYTRDGRHLLLAGRRGHIAAVEWERGHLRCELELNDTISAAKWLQNVSMFAVAQKQNVYIYDGNSGAEMHRLAKHIQVEFLEYLPYHYLLASAGGPAGILNYQDITTGQMVAEHRTMDNGRCRVMRQNPSNGLMHLGHAGGVVTFWTPAVGGPVVTMQCHTAPVTAIAIDRAGHYMASASAAGDIRVWDLRTYKALHEYRPVRPAISLDISQRGILAAGHGPHVTMWAEGLAKRSEHPYMQHLQAGNTINCVRFIPYDDILGVGHSGGFDSLIVPGAGEPNYDAFEANPMASRSQRREAEVKQLLNKLPPETIMLDPSSIGTVARTEMERHSLKADLEFGAVNPDGTKRSKRQRATPRKKQLDRAKRRENIIDEEKMRQNEIVINSARPVEAETKTALDRFKLKPL